MKKLAPNHSMEPNPRPSRPLWQVIERMLLAAAKVVTAVAKLVRAVTGLLWVLGLLG